MVLQDLRLRLERRVEKVQESNATIDWKPALLERLKLFERYEPLPKRNPFLKLL